jgi:hypothetical protein
MPVIPTLRRLKQEDGKQVQGQPGLHCKTLFQNKSKQKTLSIYESIFLSYSWCIINLYFCAQKNSLRSRIVFFTVLCFCICGLSTQQDLRPLWINQVVADAVSAPLISICSYHLSAHLLIPICQHLHFLKAFSGF